MRPSPDVSERREFDTVILPSHPANSQLQLSETQLLHLIPNCSVVSSSGALSNGIRNAIRDGEVRELGRSHSPDD